MRGLVTSDYSIFAEYLAATGATADLQQRDAHPLPSIY